MDSRKKSAFSNMPPTEVATSPTWSLGETRLVTARPCTALAVRHDPYDTADRNVARYEPVRRHHLLTED